VAALVPFNYPLLLLAFKLAPALVTGNTVVVKPAPDTPVSLDLIGRILADELPAGVAGTLRGGASVGDRLVRHPDVDLVAFTGSTLVGRRIAAACAEAGTATHLEMGGKDPAVVCGDVDPDLAAEAVVWASFLNAGQVCTSTERVYVDRSIHDRFLERAVRLTEKMRVGDPFDAATQVGPMRTDRGRAAVVEHLDEARAAGAEVLAGGELIERPGFYLAPAVVAGVDHGMRLMTEETFGPVMPVMAFDTLDEAFALAADTPYGLGASLYTRDPSIVERAARELAVGTLWVNDPVVDNLAAPFGGMRASGTVRELGPEALDAFTRPRHVHWNLDLVRKPWWFQEE
jgi:acyl-CoA reductase-like NAD-dependent aldehyde dehydrogenase